MQPSLFVAIDPGAAGAAVIRHSIGEIVDIVAHDGDDSIVGVARTAAEYSNATVVIEQVWGSPVMGVSSAFAFGVNFGKWVGALKAHQIPVYAVTPQAWQKIIVPDIEGQGVERKRALKAAAAQMFPEHKATMAVCDALLISEYAVRQYKAGKKLGELL